MVRESKLSGCFPVGFLVRLLVEFLVGFPVGLLIGFTRLWFEPCKTEVWRLRQRRHST